MLWTFSEQLLGYYRPFPPLLQVFMDRIPAEKNKVILQPSCKYAQCHRWFKIVVNMKSDKHHVVHLKQQPRIPDKLLFQTTKPFLIQIFHNIKNINEPLSVASFQHGHYILSSYRLWTFYKLQTFSSSAVMFMMKSQQKRNHLQPSFDWWSVSMVVWNCSKHEKGPVSFFVFHWWYLINLLSLQSTKPFLIQIFPYFTNISEPPSVAFEFH